MPLRSCSLAVWRMEYLLLFTNLPFIDLLLRQFSNSSRDARVAADAPDSIDAIGRDNPANRIIDAIKVFIVIKAEEVNRVLI